MQTCPDVPWIIFRPTGVYGPHEKDYLMMIESIDRHLDFGIGFRKQMLTFVYVEDLVGAIFDALQSDKTLKKKYIISEPRAYSQREFRHIVSKPARRTLGCAGSLAAVGCLCGVCRCRAVGHVEG